jgi:CBS domain containing-hemolysin-like protein
MWLACVGLLLARSLTSAAKAALYGISDIRAKELSADFPRAGGRVLRHKTERERTAGALWIGAVLSGFLAAAIGAMAPPAMLQFTRYGASPYLALLTALAGALLVVAIAAVLDLSARSMAAANAEAWALRLSWVVSLLVFFLNPFIRLLVALLDLLVRPFGGHVRFETPPPPLEELEKLLTAQAAATEGVDKGAPQLIRSIFELSDKHARDVMVPRTDVIAVDVTTPPLDILRTLTEEGHSRIPVYRDDIDHIVGVLHARDLIPLLQHPELIVLIDIVRPAAFTPWMKPIGDLLREMQKKHIHMSMVVDEYGGFMGVVTIEDILREIVGDIADEFEKEEKPIERQADGSFLVDAGLDVGGFTKALGLALPEGEYETLGGFVSSLAGSIPEVGERFNFNGWQFTVHSKEGARLSRVRVVKPGPKQPRDPPVRAEPVEACPEPSRRAPPRSR